MLEQYKPRKVTLCRPHRATGAIVDTSCAQREFRSAPLALRFSLPWSPRLVCLLALLLCSVSQDLTDPCVLCNEIQARTIADVVPDTCFFLQSAHCASKTFVTSVTASASSALVLCWSGPVQVWCVPCREEQSRPLDERVRSQRASARSERRRTEHEPASFPS